MARKVPDSDGESMEVKPVVRKRKKADTSLAPGGSGNKAPRRSGRFRRPPSPLHVPVESGRRSTGSRRARKSIEVSPSIEIPSSIELSPSPDMASPSPKKVPRRTSEAQNINPVAVGDSVQDAFDNLEHDLHTTQEESRRQLQEIKELQQQLREKCKSQKGAHPQAPMKRDKVIEEKDKEIKDLQDLLKMTRDFRIASRLALDTRDKELERLREKHKCVIKAACIVTNKWGGMGDLAQAVEDAAE